MSVLTTAEKSGYDSAVTTLALIPHGVSYEWGGPAAAGNASTNYLNAGNFSTAIGTTQTASRHVVRFAQTLTTIVVDHASALGSSDTVTYTLQKSSGGASAPTDTAITVTVGANVTQTSATSFSLSVSIGDVLAMKSVQAGTGVAAGMAPRVIVY